VQMLILHYGEITQMGTNNRFVILCNYESYRSFSSANTPSGLINSNTSDALPLELII
jgi:hypothetical protein